MQVRFIRDFRGHAKGEVFDVHDDIARYWFDIGIARPVPEEPHPTTEEKGLVSPIRDKALHRPRKQKKLS